MKQITFLLVLLVFLGCKQTPSVDAYVKNLITADAEWSEEGFKTPPHSAKSLVWYNWMNGHFSKEVITKDLEAMAAMGIGGFRVFNAAEGTPPGSAIFFGDEWWDTFIHTKKEA
ncbi:glycosyl hydrolase, partial [Mariniphaga sediminis]|uniref:glycosyl hydrolase n=1 Tax=Mariniphaga sediminis TaxID=1628158 RepID=UPI00356623D5